MSAEKKAIRKKINDSFSPQIFFLFFVLLIGLTATFTMPAGGGLDEPQHLARVEQIASGQLTPVFTGYAKDYPVSTDKERANASLYGGQGDNALFSLASRGLRNFQANEHQYSFPLWSDPESATDKAFDSEGMGVHVFSNTAVNAPIVYLPYLIGFFLGRLLNLSIFWLIMFMRLIGLAFYIVAVYWCIRIIPIGKWPLAVIAILPATVSSVSTVSADTITVILTFFMIALFFKALYSENLSTAHWVALGVVSILLPIAKVAYTPFLGFLIALPVANKSFRNRASLIKLGVFFLGGLLLLAFWYSIISGINTGAMWKPQINPSEQLALILSNPLHFLKVLLFSMPFIDPLQATSMGANGEFSYAYYTDFGWFGIIMLCIATVLHEKDELSLSSPPHRSISLAFLADILIFTICAILVFLALYLTFSEVGSNEVSGMQNRYFIPLAPLLLLPISALSLYNVIIESHGQTDKSCNLKKTEPHTQKPTYAIALYVGLCIFSFADYASYIITILHSTL